MAGSGLQHTPCQSTYCFCSWHLFPVHPNYNSITESCDSHTFHHLGGPSRAGWPWHGCPALALSSYSSLLRNVVGLTWHCWLGMSEAQNRSEIRYKLQAAELACCKTLITEVVLFWRCHNCSTHHAFTFHGWSYIPLQTIPSPVCAWQAHYKWWKLGTLFTYIIENPNSCITLFLFFLRKQRA